MQTRQMIHSGRLPSSVRPKPAFGFNRPHRLGVEESHSSLWPVGTHAKAADPSVVGGATMRSLAKECPGVSTDDNAVNAFARWWWSPILGTLSIECVCPVTVQQDPDDVGAANRLLHPTRMPRPSRSRRCQAVSWPPPGRARGRHPAGLLAAGGLDLGVSHIAPSLRAPSTQRCPIPGLPPAGCVRVGRAWTTRAGSASVWWLIACPVTIAVRVQRRTERTRRCVSHKLTIVSIGNIVGV